MLLEQRLASQEQAALEIGSVLTQALTCRKSDLFKLLALNCELYYQKLDMVVKMAQVIGDSRLREAKAAFRLIEAKAKLSRAMGAIIERLDHRLENRRLEILE